jgi:hypothetical protein
VPQPVVDLSRSELRAYIEGNDPTSGRPFVREVIEALTCPLDAEDLTGLSFDRSTPRLPAPESEANLQRLFIENHWTDYLPIVRPTEERVAAMMKGTSHPSDEIVGRMRPTSFREFWEYTVEKVAVNAVMAGSPRILSGDPGAGGERINRQIQQHDLDDQHGGGQRPDPP